MRQALWFSGTTYSGRQLDPDAIQSTETPVTRKKATSGDARRLKGYRPAGPEQLLNLIKAFETIHSAPTK
jgi:hypothetical protein